MEKKMRVYTGLLSILVVAVCASTLLAADWRAGLARADITPQEPIWLFGHAGRDRPSTGIIHSLWAKALVIEDAQGERMVIITTDLPGMQNKEVEEICTRIKEETGLERERIAINFSHTHCGPLLSGLLSPAYRALVEPPEHWEVIDAYTRMVQDRIVEAVVKATGAMQPVNLAYGEDECQIRNDALQSFEDEINRDRSFHDKVPVLRINAENGEPLAILFGYASHGQAAGYQIHGTYPGFAQIEIEKKYPGTQAMFMLGCGAMSVTHKGFGPAGSETDGKLLAEAVFRAMDGDFVNIRPGNIAAAFARVELAFNQPADRPQLEQRRRAGIRNQFQQTRDEFLLEYAEEHGEMPAGYEAPKQVFHIGEDLTFVILSGEIAEGYAYRISEMEYPDRRMWVVGFSNDLFAYVPTRGVLRAGNRVGGGRVAGSSQLYWGWPSRWADDVEERIVNKVKELVEQADRTAGRQ